MLYLKNLEKKYGDFLLFDKIDYTFHDNEIYGIIGKNGVGKTTLFKVVTGIVPVDSGEVIFEHSEDTMYYLGDSPFLYEELTGEEFLEFSAKMLGFSKDDSELISMCKSIDIQPYLFNRIKTYSFGMKKKLALIVAFMSKAKYIVLDEATNGIDKNSLERITEIIRCSSKKRTFFIINHESELLESIYTKRVYLENGKLVE
ncbi:ABC-type multidrug transport system, ATPase component [Pilibacter termitis]|uniref:ABC-type multidrug transport system, ATPase component n=1 Tax=Pilibacter termitis TaxID=263852 RepID=A0A1T4LBS4_9ENTE|nr:ABC transporter ATP-binding protein [Pilibacter termitis]SJZ51954.1 ABC-type multidrug transport system, ATPase component [Pilibacter termitis]